MTSEAKSLISLTTPPEIQWHFSTLFPFEMLDEPSNSTSRSMPSAPLYHRISYSPRPLVSLLLNIIVLIPPPPFPTLLLPHFLPLPPLSLTNPLQELTCDFCTTIAASMNSGIAAAETTGEALDAPCVTLPENQHYQCNLFIHDNGAKLARVWSSMGGDTTLASQLVGSC